MWKWLRTYLFKFTSTTTIPTEIGNHLFSEKINGRWTYPILVFVGDYHLKTKFFGFHPYPPKLFAVRNLPEYAETHECRWESLNVENMT